MTGQRIGGKSGAELPPFGDKRGEETQNGDVRWVCLGRSVLRTAPGTKARHVAQAESHTLARRIANALNRYIPSRKGY